VGAIAAYAAASVAACLLAACMAVHAAAVPFPSLCLLPPPSAVDETIRLLRAFQFTVRTPLAWVTLQGCMRVYCLIRRQLLQCLQRVQCLKHALQRPQYLTFVYLHIPAVPSGPGCHGEHLTHPSSPLLLCRMSTARWVPQG